MLILFRIKYTTDIFSKHCKWAYRRDNSSKLSSNYFYFVSVIDSITNIVTVTVNTKDGPEKVEVTPDGTGVYIANAGSNTVPVIDTATN